jgi:hypothetical protein
MSRRFLKRGSVAFPVKDGMKTPVEVLSILHSFKELSIKDGELDVKLADDTCWSVSTSFVPGSFTRELVELIEKHLLDEDLDEKKENQ